MKTKIYIFIFLMAFAVTAVNCSADTMEDFPCRPESPDSDLSSEQENQIAGLPSNSTNYTESRVLEELIGEWEYFEEDYERRLFLYNDHLFYYTIFNNLGIEENEISGIYDIFVNINNLSFLRIYLDNNVDYRIFNIKRNENGNIIGLVDVADNSVFNRVKHQHIEF